MMSSQWIDNLTGVRCDLLLHLNRIKEKRSADKLTDLLSKTGWLIRPSVSRLDLFCVSLYNTAK